MVTTNEALRDAAIRHRIWTIKHETHTYNQLLVNFLNDMDADLTKGIDKRVRALKPGKPESFEIRKFKKLQTFVRESVKEQTSLLNKDMSEELKKLAEYEAEWQATSLARELLVDYDVVTPTPATLRSIITERPLQGYLLNDWTSQWGASKVNRVTGSLRLGLAQGQTAEEIVRAITGTKARNYQDGILDISRRGARMLVRTTSNDVMTKARESVYKENSDLLKGIGWLSTLDSRTTPICRARDGIVYPVNEGPRPPAHANCRSTTYPVTKSFRELGFDLDEFPKGNRPSVVDGMAGDVPATETYQTWLQKQSFKFQDQVLGVSKAKLFREGNMKLTQFVEEPSGREYTLEELKRLEPEIWNRTFGPGGVGGSETREPHIWAKDSLDENYRELTTHFEEPKIGSSGEETSWYLPEDGTIYLRNNTGLDTKTHEFGHYIDHQIRDKTAIRKGYNLRSLDASDDIMTDRRALREKWKKTAGAGDKDAQHAYLWKRHKEDMQFVDELKGLTRPQKIAELQRRLDDAGVPLDANEFVEKVTRNIEVFKTQNPDWKSVFGDDAPIVQVNRYARAFKEDNASLVVDFNSHLMFTPDGQSNLLGTMYDYFGAITHNTIGNGHSKEYYARDYGLNGMKGGLFNVSAMHSAEAFANYASLSTNKEAILIMERFTPNTVRAFRGLIKDALDRLTK